MGAPSAAMRAAGGTSTSHRMLLNSTGLLPRTTIRTNTDWVGASRSVPNPGANDNETSLWHATKSPLSHHTVISTARRRRVRIAVADDRRHSVFVSKRAIGNLAHVQPLPAATCNDSAPRCISLDRQLRENWGSREPLSSIGNETTTHCHRNPLTDCSHATASGGSRPFPSCSSPYRRALNWSIWPTPSAIASRPKNTVRITAQITRAPMSPSP